MFKSKRGKQLLFGLIGLVVLVVAAILGLGLLGGQRSNQTAQDSFKLAEAKEGKLSSSILLTGKVKANEEQYVYYDSTKGNLNAVSVNVGDQVQVGQVLASYDATEAQRNYDAAVRALNKVDRQIYELKTYGQVVETTGDGATDASSTASAQRSVDGQLKDLNDSRADAVDAVNKAQEALNATNEVSTVNGTVVEVNRDVSKSTTAASQTLVHVVDNSSLIISGEMSEYNLANISLDQEVTITSKVYPDQTWTGKVSHISDYPTAGSTSSAPAQDNSGISGSSGNSGSNSKYPFKISLTSEVGNLKQGFTVNIQVNSNTVGILVPVDAVLTDDQTNYYVFTYDEKKKTIKRTEVQIASADGANQQISSGLNAGDKIIANPNKNLQNGQEVQINETSAD